MLLGHDRRDLGNVSRVRLVKTRFLESCATGAVKLNSWAQP